MFDLDNTLYPHDLNLWQQIDDRIRSFVSDFLKVTKDEAFRVQKDYYKRYGTTMRGLMAEHGMKPDDFLEFVHEIDHSPLLPNAELGDAIEKLPGRKLILTNGTRKHAEAVMKRLDIDRHFEDVFDIAAADLDPKPHPQVYDRFLHKHGVDPQKAAMFEDLARNLSVPHALGMTTVLVVPPATREVFREGWELEGREAAHVDHVTDDLTGFLRKIAGLAPFPAAAREMICGRAARRTHVARRSRQDHRRRLREARRHQRPRPRARCARRSRPRSICSTAARRASPSAAATAPGRSTSG